MALALMSPSDFARWVAVEGLLTKGGKVRLNKYMSTSPSHGGSHTSQDLMSKIGGLMKRQGFAPFFRNWDRLSMGQGYPQDFMTLWDWMYDNLKDLRKLDVQTWSMKDEVKIPGKVLHLAEVFKDGHAFTDGMAVLVDNGCFGWDCIGFVCQYLITINHLTQYETWKSHNYISHGKFVPIKTLDEITPLCILVFGEVHIVLVDQVQGVWLNDKTGALEAKVTVSQSYKGTHGDGPQTWAGGLLRQSRVGKGFGATIQQTGVIDVDCSVRVAKHPDLVAQYPPYIAIPALTE